MCIILVVPIRTFSHKVKIATRQSVLCYPITSAVPESTHYLVKRPESGAVQGAMGSFGRQGGRSKFDEETNEAIQAEQAYAQHDTPDTT